LTDEIEIKPKRQPKKSPSKKKSAKPTAKKQIAAPATTAPESAALAVEQPATPE
jgi:hypothetical protein